MRARRALQIQVPEASVLTAEAKECDFPGPDRVIRIELASVHSQGQGVIYPATPQVLALERPHISVVTWGLSVTKW